MSKGIGASFQKEPYLKINTPEKIDSIVNDTFLIIKS